MPPPRHVGTPLRASWPHRELHRRPPCQGPHVATSQFPQIPRTFRGPRGSSTEGPSARARMPPAHYLRHTPHTFRGPRGISTEGPSGRARMPSPHPFWPTPHTLCGPVGSSTEGPIGSARMPPPRHFGTPLTRFVPSSGAPPKTILTDAVLIAAHGSVVRQANLPGAGNVPSSAGNIFSPVQEIFFRRRRKYFFAGAGNIFPRRGKYFFAGAGNIFSPVQEIFFLPPRTDFSLPGTSRRRNIFVYFLSVAREY